MNKKTKKLDVSKLADNVVMVQVPNHVYEPLKDLADVSNSTVDELLRRGGKLYLLCVEIEKKAPGSGLYLHQPGCPPQQIVLLEKLLTEGGAQPL